MMNTGDIVTVLPNPTFNGGRSTGWAFRDITKPTKARVIDGYDSIVNRGSIFVEFPDIHTVAGTPKRSLIDPGFIRAGHPETPEGQYRVRRQFGTGAVYYEGDSRETAEAVAKALREARPAFTLVIERLESKPRWVAV